MQSNFRVELYRQEKGEIACSNGEIIYCLARCLRIIIELQFHLWDKQFVNQSVTEWLFSLIARMIFHYFVAKLLLNYLIRDVLIGTTIVILKEMKLWIWTSRPLNFIVSSIISVLYILIKTLLSILLSQLWGLSSYHRSNNLKYSIHANFFHTAQNSFLGELKIR